MVALRSFSNHHFARSFSELCESLFGGGAEVPDTWQIAVSLYLHRRGYHQTGIAEVLGHAATYGTVQDCPVFEFDERDRDEVEGLLPEWPDLAWWPFEGQWEPACLLDVFA